MRGRGTDSGTSLSFDFIALLFVSFCFVLFCFVFALLFVALICMHKYFKRQRRATTTTTTGRGTSTQKAAAVPPPPTPFCTAQFDCLHRNSCHFNPPPSPSHTPGKPLEQVLFRKLIRSTVEAGWGGRGMLWCTIE